MKIRSPLANLTESLSQVLASAKLNMSTLQNNEAATRAVLVDPILQALGWNTGNPTMVEVEKTFLQARVDYALYDSNGDVKVIIEAKKLGADLNNQSILLSLVNYAFTSGVKDIFLTDGLLWSHFTGFEPGILSPSTVLDLRKDALVEIAAYLVHRLDAARYWPEEKDVDELSQQINQLESTIANLEKELNLIRFGNKPEEFINTQLSENVQADFVALEKIGSVTGTTPSRLRLPDSTVISVKYWSDILREICKFAMESNPLISLPLPDRSGKKVNLFDIVRPHKGISYVEVEYQGKPVFVYTNYDANNCIANSIHALRQVPKEKIHVPAGVLYSKRAA